MKDIPLTNKFATLYNMYASFQEPYYLTKRHQPIFNPKGFKKLARIAHIDFSYQKNPTQTGSVVLRVESETNTATSEDITVYCLVVREKRFTYNKIVPQL